MDNIQQAIDLIESEYKLIVIDYTNKDMTALCFLGKDAELIIESLKRSIELEHEMRRLNEKYIQILEAKETQIKMLMQRETELLEKLRNIYELSVQPVILNVPEE